MNITGAVRIDLSYLVDHGLLHIGESKAFDIWQALGDPRYSCELYIGDAVDVVWPPRMAESLQDAAHVRVTGTNSRGVAAAIRGLEQLFERGAA